MSDGEEIELEEERKVRRPKKKKAEKKKEEEDGKEQGDSSEAEDGDKANKNEEETNKVIEHLEEMAKHEMELLHKIYAETFIRRVLRLIEIFTSVAQTSNHPLALVSKVTSPYMLFLLVNFTLIASPRTKMLAIKTMENLINIGIPA